MNEARSKDDMRIPERETVLRRLVDALRPGGVLMLEEDDIGAGRPGPERGADDLVDHCTVEPGGSLLPVPGASMRSHRRSRHGG